MHEVLYLIIGRFAAGVVRAADASMEPNRR
jgi:hypothetical protein